MVALINSKRLKASFHLRNIGQEMHEMDKCKTAHELFERYPRTYHNQFDWLFNDYDVRDKMRELLYESESFYEGFFASKVYLSIPPSHKS